MNKIEMNIRTGIASIMNNEDGATEKIEQLKKYKEKVLEEFNKAILDAQSGYTYCDRCKRWYRNNTWIVKAKKETRRCLSFTPKAGEEIVYGEKDVIMRKLECPAGHLQSYKELK